MHAAYTFRYARNGRFSVFSLILDANIDEAANTITMADEKNADRSSIEIKTLLRKLHPDRGNHKDRIKKLNRFRSYVMVSGVRTVCKSI